MIVGRRYNVTVDDCCVELRFTARLLAIDKQTGDPPPDHLWDDEDSYGLEFDNGVVVPGGWHGAIKMEEVDDQE